MCTLVSKSKTEEFLKEHEGVEFVEAYKVLCRYNTYADRKYYGLFHQEGSLYSLFSPYYQMEYKPGLNTMSLPLKTLDLQGNFEYCYCNDGIHVCLTEERAKFWLEPLSHHSYPRNDVVIVKVKCYLSNLMGVGVTPPRADAQNDSQGDAVFKEVYLDEQEYKKFTE